MSATEIQRDLIQVSRLVLNAIEDWGQGEADGSCNVLLYPEVMAELEAIFERFDELPENPNPQIIESGPVKVARIFNIQLGDGGV